MKFHMFWWAKSVNCPSKNPDVPHLHIRSPRWKKPAEVNPPTRCHHPRGVKLGWPGIPLWLGWCLFWPPNASFWEKLFDADIGFTTSKWLINRIIYWDLPTMINQPFKEVFINGEIKWWINHLPTIYQPFIGVLLMVFIDVYWVSHRDAVSSPWRLVRFGHHADPPQRPCFPRFPCFPRRWRRRETTSSASPRNMPYRSIDIETQRHKCIDIRYFYFESNEEEVNSRNKKEGEQLNLPINCMLFDSGHPKSSLGWFLIYIYVCVCLYIVYVYTLYKAWESDMFRNHELVLEILADDSMIRWFDDCWLVIQHGWKSQQ